MANRKEQTESKPAFVPPKNFLNLDDRLVKQFEAKSHSLYNGPPAGCQLADKVQAFVQHLILSNDPTELVHFASLHNQAALYNTLKEFIALNLDKCDLPEHLRPTKAEKAEFMELAAQFFTLAYCQLHEPNNQKHTDRWAYWLSIDLRRILRLFQAPADQQSPASAAARDVLITSPLVAAPSPAPPVTPPPSSGTGQVPPPARPAPPGLPPLPDSPPQSVRPAPEKLPWLPDQLPAPRPPRTAVPSEPSSNLRIPDPPVTRQTKTPDPAIVQAQGIQFNERQLNASLSATEKMDCLMNCWTGSRLPEICMALVLVIWMFTPGG